jgi:TPP-dependent pyruvate/acetoin dehydrogenase alpha subunit
VSTSVEVAATVGQLGDDELAWGLTIRHFEQALLDLFGQGHIKGTVHTCIGQEYIPVALAPLLEGDFVFSNHRGHGHYLALHRDPAGLLAEILGREGAVCHGVGGSQHVYRDEGFLTTGIQGESLPVAVGVALHLRRAEPGRLAVVFTGDGTWGEGAVYEALNMAGLWSVPLLVVVEHNGIAQSTPTERQLAGTIADRAAAFGIPHKRFDSVDAAGLRAEVRPLVARLRTEPGPMVLEFSTVRLGPHSKGDDTRDGTQLRALRERDWTALYAHDHPDQYRAADLVARQRVAGVVADVLARPASTWAPACHRAAGHLPARRRADGRASQPHAAWALRRGSRPLPAGRGHRRPVRWRFPRIQRTLHRVPGPRHHHTVVGERFHGRRQRTRPRRQPGDRRGHVR